MKSSQINAHNCIQAGQLTKVYFTVHCKSRSKNPPTRYKLMFLPTSDRSSPYNRQGIHIQDDFIRICPTKTIS